MPSKVNLFPLKLLKIDELFLLVYFIQTENPTHLKLEIERLRSSHSIYEL